MVSTLEVSSPAVSQEDHGKTFTLKLGESISIGENREVTVRAIDGNTVKVRVKCPDHARRKKKQA